jgi:hypothetical protein
VIVDEVYRWLVEHPHTSLREIRLAAFDAETAGLFATAIAARRDGG